MVNLLDVCKKYNADTKIKLKDYSFEINKSYCILGPSGSGKSTLLNIIAGIVKPTTGKVIIGGTEITSLTETKVDGFRYKNIGYITQDLKLFEDFTVKDNLEIVAMGGELTFSPKDVLEWVGLEHKLNSKVKALSGGEKQRVAIARSLLKSPSVMLCDEPTGSLNTAKGIEIMELIVKLHKMHKNTLIVVTHDDRMAKYFDEVIRFEDMLGGVEFD